MNISEDSMNIGILTVSDSCKLYSAEDKSGPALIKEISEKKWNLIKYDIVQDAHNSIQAILISWCETEQFDIIFTTGGTGFTTRDVTPEATSSVIDRHAPGLQQSLLIRSLEITPMAMLSRGIAGIRNKTIIINLPGSPKAVVECFQILGPVLPHAVDQVSGRFSKVKSLHSRMIGASSHHSCSHNHKAATDAKEESTGHHHEMHNPKEVARRPRHSLYPLISVDEALGIVTNNSLTIGTYYCSLEEAYGLVAAEAIIAEEAVPPFPASIKDGYAVVASDGDGTRRVIGATNAGDWTNQQVHAGACQRISTGAPVPPGADAVVQVEDTELIQASDDGSQEITIRIVVPPKKVGQDIRPAGSDISVGDVVVDEGAVMHAGEIGLAASVGRAKVKCYRRPVIGVLSTGDELIDMNSPFETGKIRDSNRISLKQLIEHQGYTVQDLGIAGDNICKLREKLEIGLVKCDVLITSGGVSMGEKDLLRHVLVHDYKAEIHFGRVFMKPGKPTTFATIDYPGCYRKKLIFGLPGNPVSALVTCQLYVLPALRKISGIRHWENTVIRARLGSSIALDPRPEYHRCVLQWRRESDIPVAISTGNQISSRLLSMAGVHCLLKLPPWTEEQPGLQKDTVVDALLMNS